jgi:hypothetical protein
MACEVSSDGLKVKSATPVATEDHVTTGNANIIIAHRYWEFKRRASSLNSRARLIGTVADHSI